MQHGTQEKNCRISTVQCSSLFLYPSNTINRASTVSLWGNYHCDLLGILNNGSWVNMHRPITHVTHTKMWPIWPIACSAWLQYRILESSTESVECRDQILICNTVFGIEQRAAKRCRASTRWSKCHTCGPAWRCCTWWSACPSPNTWHTEFDHSAGCTATNAIIILRFTLVLAMLPDWPEISVKLCKKVMSTCIAHTHETSLRRSGIARIVKGYRSLICTPCISSNVRHVDRLDDVVLDDQPVPSYPMGPAGPGPQASGGPQRADALIFSSREISVTVYFSLAK